MCLGGAPDRDLKAPGPLASCATLACSSSFSLPLVHMAVLALSPLWCAAHCKVLWAREMMPPCSLALLLLGIQLVPSVLPPPPPSPLRVKCVQESHARSRTRLRSCVWMAGRSFDVFFDVEAGGSGEDSALLSQDQWPRQSCLCELCLGGLAHRNLSSQDCLLRGKQPLGEGEQ